MRHVRLVHVVALIVGAFLLAPGPVAAKPSLARSQIAVSLDGRASTVAAGAINHCHDLKRNSLVCFRSAAARDRAARDLLAARPRSVAGNGYVIAWIDASYLGASVVLSQDYADLSTIGWNDRISSYKVYTSLTGAFYEHSPYWGLTRYFCCFSQVGYVGNAYNDIFSSFDLP